MALELLIGDIELLVAEHAEEMIFVHAGCRLEGRAIVVPGRTLAGKSTLSAHLRVTAPARRLDPSGGAALGSGRRERQPPRRR